MGDNKLIIKESDLSIKWLKKQDKRLKGLIETIGNIECNIHNDSFSFIVEEIVGQMLSNKVATILNKRLVELCDGIIQPERINNKTINDLKSIVEQKKY